MEAVRRRPLPLGATIPTWSVSLAVFRLYGLGQGGPTVLSWAKAQNSPVTGLRWVAWVLSPPLCTTNLHYHWPKTILKKKKNLAENEEEGIHGSFSGLWCKTRNGLGCWSRAIDHRHVVKQQIKVDMCQRAWHEAANWIIVSHSTRWICQGVPTLC